MIGDDEMYICLACGKLSENLEHHVEKHGFTYGPFEEWDGCPRCGGNSVEAHVCSCCGDWIRGNYIKIDDERICENCYISYELGDED